MRVAVDAPDLLGQLLAVLRARGVILALRQQATETGAWHVDENQVAGVQQAVIVVGQLVRRGRRMRVVIGHDPLRTPGTHVQPHGRGTRAAVVDEGDRTLGRVDALLEVGEVAHRDLGRGFLGTRAVDHQRAGDGLVVDRLAFDRDGAGGRGRHRLHQFLDEVFRRLRVVARAAGVARGGAAGRRGCEGRCAAQQQGRECNGKAIGFHG